MVDSNKSAKGTQGETTRRLQVSQRSLLGAHDGLARLIIQLSFGVLVIGFVAVALMAATPQAEIVKDAFNILIPVLSTWVGAVVTFYFSDKSQERLNQTLTDVIDHRTVMAATPISMKMIARDQIKGLAESSRSDNQIDVKAPIKNIVERMTQIGISRLVVLKHSRFTYVVHKPTLKSFIAERVLEKEDIQANEISGMTLDDFLKVQEFKKMAEDKVVFVPIHTTLAGARDALRKVQGAEDIFVTLNGRRDEEVLGWMTDVDLLSLLGSE